MLVFHRKNFKSISKYVLWYVLIILIAFAIDVFIWVWFEQDTHEAVNHGMSYSWKSPKNK